MNFFNKVLTNEKEFNNFDENKIENDDSESDDDEKKHLKGKIGDVMMNIGAIYNEIGKIEEAKEYLEKALVIQKKSYEPKHLSIAHSLHNLGKNL